MSFEFRVSSVKYLVSNVRSRVANKLSMRLQPLQFGMGIISGCGSGLAASPLTAKDFADCKSTASLKFSSAKLTLIPSFNPDISYQAKYDDDHCQ